MTNEQPRTGHHQDLHTFTITRHDRHGIDPTARRYRPGRRRGLVASVQFVGSGDAFGSGGRLQTCILVVDGD